MTSLVPRIQYRISSLAMIALAVALSCTWIPRLLSTFHSIASNSHEEAEMVNFAITGRIDLNEDGLSDHLLVKDLIMRAGGRVIAMQDSAGRIHGKISLEVHYIIVDETSCPGFEENRMVKLARHNGAIALDVQQLLRQINNPYYEPRTY